MTAPAPTEGLLKARVAEIRRKQKEPRAIGFHVPVAWSGAPSIEVDGVELPVAFCPSVLAFRERLARAEAEGVPAVLLTDRAEGDLGQDVLARLDKRGLHRLKPWEALGNRFGVTTNEIDRRLRDYEWLPGHLLAIPESDLVKPATGFLELDEVWQLLLSRLGLSSSRPDLRELLEWTARPEGLAAFERLPPEVREAHVRWLADSAGEAGRAVLHLVTGKRGGDAVAAGLVCERLFSDSTGRAVGRFEAAYLKGDTLQPEAGRAWADAATAMVLRKLDSGGEAAAAPWLTQAGNLLAELKLEPLGDNSSWLPAGYSHAVSRFAEVLSRGLDRSQGDSLPDLAAAGRDVADHRLARFRPETDAVLVALRLARWLAGSPSPKPAGSFAEAAARYAREGSYVDLARTLLTDAPGLPPVLGNARDRLLRAAEERREAESRRFAELLATWPGPGSERGDLVPLESVLDRVIIPLAAVGPVLLLVLDGMSYAVFRELAADLGRLRWEQIWALEEPVHLSGVGLLPTITQVCRTSLLSGERRQGGATDEEQGFARHPGLRRYTTPAHPPEVFHKADLGNDDGAGLSRKVRDAVAGTSRRAVAVVLNVVDDQLPKGHQLLRRWEISVIRFLEEILRAAEAAGRTVVLTADHGHVVERSTELRRQEGGGARFRPATKPPAEGEVQARGPRVLADGGSGLVLAWSERLRYSNLQSGYHGGASPQEALVPLSVWAPFDSTIPGWEPATVDEPAWWQDEIETMPSEVARPAPAPPKAQPRTRQPTLFDAGPVTPDPWLDRLLASPVYHEQRKRAGRQGLSDDDVRAALAALDERGGSLTLTALARQRGLQTHRVYGLVAALQRILNVEGFQVLSLDSSSETVTLDRKLLETQFPPEGKA